MWNTTLPLLNLGGKLSAVDISESVLEPTRPWDAPVSDKSHQGTGSMLPTHSRRRTPLSLDWHPIASLAGCHGFCGVESRIRGMADLRAKAPQGTATKSPHDCADPDLAAPPLPPLTPRRCRSRWGSLATLGDPARLPNFALLCPCERSFF